MSGPLRFLRRTVCSVPCLVTCVLLCQVGLYFKSAPEARQQEEDSKVLPEVPEDLEPVKENRIAKGTWLQKEFGGLRAGLAINIVKLSLYPFRKIMASCM